MILNRPWRVVPTDIVTHNQAGRQFRQWHLRGVIVQTRILDFV
jgi:hypothetical protein